MPIADLAADSPLMTPRFAVLGDNVPLSDAFNNAHGQLHSQLGVPSDQSIPKSKLLAAAKGKYGKKAKKRAVPAINMQKARG